MSRERKHNRAADLDQMEDFMEKLIGIGVLSMMLVAAAAGTVFATVCLTDTKTLPVDVGNALLSPRTELTHSLLAPFAAGTATPAMKMPGNDARPIPSGRDKIYGLLSSTRSNLGPNPSQRRPSSAYSLVGVPEVGSSWSLARHVSLIFESEADRNNSLAGVPKADTQWDLPSFSAATARTGRVPE
jgi:hypothetical protein